MERFVFVLAFSPILFFASWTIACHFAIITGLSWDVLQPAFAWAAIPLCVLCIAVTSRVSALCSSISNRETLNEYNRPWKNLVIFALVLGILFTITQYKVRWAICLLVLIIPIVLHRSKPLYCKPQECASGTLKQHWLFLFILAALAITYTLISHRTDADDSTYLEIIRSTLEHRSLPIFSFDVSLGEMIPHFRFPVYRASTYELLAGFLVSATGIDLLTVYYFILPSINAFLTVAMGWVVSRFFLSSQGATLATALLIIILMAWGETHIAFGNRLFVRLFQGKGMLIACTTPACVYAGLLFSQQPRMGTWVLLFGSVVAGIGVSSSGLVVSIVAAWIGLLAGCANLGTDSLKKLLVGGLVSLYPVVLAWYLMSGSVTLTGTGTYLPVEASLGAGARPAIALGILCYGALFQLYRLPRQFLVLCLVTLLFTMNPVLSEILASFTSRNMNWRIIWAAPLPILMAICLASGLETFSTDKLRKSLSPLIAVGLLVVFLASGQWTMSPANNNRIDVPRPKVENYFYIAGDITAIIESSVENPIILATDEIARWIPMHRKKSSLVMPGHVYPILLQFVIGQEEFSERMQLFALVNSDFIGQSRDKIIPLMKKYKVSCIVVPAARKLTPRIQDLFSQTSDCQAELLPSNIQGYDIFLVRCL